MKARRKSDGEIIKVEAIVYNAKNGERYSPSELDFNVDAEGEEMLTVEANLVKELYQRAKEIEEESKRNHSPLVAAKYRGVQRAIEDLFGSKCLPDNVDSLEPKPAEPKYHIGQYVRHKPTRLVDVIEGISQTAPYIYHFKHMVNPINSQGIFESDLEPYTEQKEVIKMKPIESKVSVYLATKEEDEEFRLLLHKNEFTWNTSTSLISLACWSPVFEDNKIHYVHPDKTVTYCGEKESDTLTFSEFKKQYFGENVNLSQETANCDKSFDNILKNSFAKERRLNIAAMAMQGIIANGELADPDEVTAMAIIYADELIKKAEEGGEK